MRDSEISESAIYNGKKEYKFFYALRLAVEVHEFTCIPDMNMTILVSHLTCFAIYLSRKLDVK